MPARRLQVATAWLAGIKPALGGLLCPAPYFGNASGVAAVDGNILPMVHRGIPDCMVLKRSTNKVVQTVRMRNLVSTF